MTAQLVLLLALTASPVAPNAGATFCGIAPPSASLDDEPPQLLELVASSAQLVEGTVVRLEPSTRAVHASFVVRVDAWLSWPDAVARPAELTFLANGAPPKIGDRAYFAGRIQQEGEGVTLLEEACFDAATYPHVATDFPIIHDYVTARDLYDRLAKSELVIRGMVLSVKTLPSKGHISEHSPVWAEAVVAVKESACGDHPTSVRVRFDQSIDLANFKKPKLYTSESVVLLLERDTASGFDGDAYAIPKPGELLDAGQWPTVKQLATTPLRLELTRAHPTPKPPCNVGVECGGSCCESAARCCVSPVNGRPVCIPSSPGVPGDALFRCPVQ